MWSDGHHHTILTLVNWPGVLLTRFGTASSICDIIATNIHEYYLLSVVFHLSFSNVCIVTEQSRLSKLSHNHNKYHPTLPLYHPDIQSMENLYVCYRHGLEQS